MNQNEKELLDAYNSLSDSEAAKLKPEELSEYENLMQRSKEDKTKGFDYETNDPKQQREIASSLFDKVRLNGYSGLSDTDKELFNKQYSFSEAAKNGRSLQEVQKYADDNRSGIPIGVGDQKLSFDADIRNPIEAIGNVGKLVREGLSVPAAGIVGTAEYAKDRLFNEGGWAAGEKPWTEYFKEALKLGSKGEGLTGVLSDPSNVVGAALPVTKAAWPIRYAIEGAKGAGLAAISDLSREGGTDNIGTDMLIGAGLGSAIGGTLATPKYNQAEKLDQAITTFPGDQRLRTMANKGSEIFEPIPRDEKIEILKSIKGEGNKEDWIRYYEDISDKAQKGYDAVDDYAKKFEGLPGAEIPMSELRAKLIDKLKSGVGTYSNKDAERFINTRLAGFIDKYGPNGSIPVKDLGLVKSKFNEDIFDPRAAVIEGTTTKRSLAKKSGSVIEDYRENRPAFIVKAKSDVAENPITELQKDLRTRRSVADFKDLLSEHTPEGQAQLLKELETTYLDDAVPYNKLLQDISPEARGLYSRSKKLEDIFQYQGAPTGSKRQGSGWGRIFPGATQIYSKTGDAYIDPVALYRMSQSVAPEMLGRATPLAETGLHFLGNKLINGIHSSKVDSTKK